MPGLSAEEYLELVALKEASARGEIEVPPEEYERLQAATQDDEDDRLQAWADAGAPEQNAKAAARAQVAPDLSPEALQTAADTVGIREQVNKARAEPVVPESPAPSLDPMFSLVPQDLAMLPATNRPEGDEGAEQDWVAKGGKDSKGTVFVYEPTLDSVKKRFLEDPAFARALYPDLPMDPQDVAALTHGSPEYQEAADHMWDETAKAATGAGKTAYRYSRAPWLHGEASSGPLKTLGTKALASVQPLGEGIESFVLGVDNTGSFGALRKAEKAIGGEVQAPNDILGVESVGGVPTAEAGKRADMLEQEHPWVYGAGQVVGALNPRTAANRVFDTAASVARAGAARLGGGRIANLLASGLGAGLGSSAAQAGQEGVNAASSVAEGGDVGATLKGAGQRVLDAGTGWAPVIGAGGEAAGQLAAGGANMLRETRGGLIGRTERAGFEFSPILGAKLSPETKAVIKRANAADNLPGDQIANDVAPAIAKAAKAELDEAYQLSRKQQDEFGATPEGARRLPATSLARQSLDLLDRNHGRVGGRLEPLRADGVEKKVKGVFNREVGAVSLTPSKGAIELTPEQAEAYLARRHLKELSPKPARGAPPAASVPLDLELPAKPPRTREEVARDLDKVWTDAEKQTAHGYTHARFYEVNDALRGQSAITPEIQKDLDELGGIFKKAVDGGHTYQGTTMRGIGLTPEEAAQLDKAQTLTAQGFMASSTDSKVANQFTNFGSTSEREVPVLFEIKQTSGVPIGKGQAEIVNRPGTQFRITGKRMQGDVPVYEVQESGYSPGSKSEGIIAGGIIGIGAAAAADEGEGAAGAAGAVAPVALAGALKKRGVKKVYVTLKHRSALEHEAVIRGLRVRDNDDPDMVRQLKHAARQDRAPRGPEWQKMLKDHSDLIGARKSVKRLVAPKGDAFGAITAYGTRKPGELRKAEALRHAAAKGGASKEVEQVRNMNDLLRLRNQHSSAHAPVTRAGMARRGMDGASTRAFPVLRSLGGPLGPIRGGNAARGERMLPDEEEEEDLEDL